MNGSKQPIGISTNPTNAELWLDNVFVGRSPVILEMSRGQDHYLHIELAGYQPYDLTFTREYNEWVIGNVAFGGFLGLAIDAISGAMYKLTPKQVQVELLAGNASYSHVTDDMFIAVVLKADPSWEKIDALIPE